MSSFPTVELQVMMHEPHFVDKTSIFEKIQMLNPNFR